MRQSAWRIPTAVAAAAVLAFAGCGEQKPPPNAAAHDANNQAPTVSTSAFAAHAVFVPAGPPKLIVALGHQDFVAGAAFSPDGTLVLTGGGDNNARLWDRASGDEIRIFHGHTREVFSIAFSPDGKKILTGSSDHTAILWDADHAAILQTFKHAGAVNCVAFSADGALVLTGSSDGTARLWNAVRGSALKTFDAKAGAINSVAISRDGGQILAGYDDHTARLWDVARNVVIHSFKTTGRVNAVAISPNGQRILTGGEDGIARLWWDWASGPQKSRDFRHPDSVRCVAFSTDGKQVLTACDDNFGRLWDAESGSEIRKFRHDGVVRSIAMSRDSRYVLTASEDDTARLWNPTTGEQIQKYSGHAAAVVCIALSPDGRQILTGSQDMSARLWDAFTGRQIQRFPPANPAQQAAPGKISPGHTGTITSIARSADGKLVLTGSRDSTARLWDATAGTTLKVFQDAGKMGVVVAVWLASDGKTLLTGSDDRVVRLWKSDSDQPVRQFAINADATERGNPDLPIAFSRDGGKALSGHNDGIARLWNVADGKLLQQFQSNTGHESGPPIRAVAIDDAGDRVVTGSSNGTVQLWNASTGLPIGTPLVGHSRQVNSLAFLPGGKQFVSGSDDGTARLWSAETGKPVHTFTLQSGEVWFVAACNCGGQQRLLTGNSDGTATFWNIASGEELCSLVSFTDGTWAVADPAGRYDAFNGGDIKGLHWVVGNEPIELVQLKQRYFDPHLLAKHLGFDKEPLRDVAAFAAPKLFPKVVLAEPAPGKTAFDIHLTNRGGGIGRVVVKINGKELTADARGPKPDPNLAAVSIPVDLASDPRLVPGAKNRIEVMAYNAEGYLCSRGERFIFVDPRKTVPPQPPDVWALIVGVSHYQGGDIDLHFAAKDADDFAAGFQVAANRLFGAKKVNLIKLTSPPLDEPNQPDAAHRPTRANLQAALAALEDSKRVKPNDIVVVYMAGHGLNGAGNDNNFYFLTCDARNADLSDPAVRASATISDQDITGWIKTSPAQKQVLILDSCHAGQVEQDLTTRRDVPSSQEIALQELKDRTGLHILAACAADQQSMEASRFRQGVLTYSLLLGMRGGALNSLKQVDVDRLFNFAVDQVPRLAAGFGGIQRPEVDSPGGASFPIGEVTPADQANIPLQPAVPLVSRSNFQDNDVIADRLRLRDQVDLLLSKVSYQDKAPLMFVDADTVPGAYQIAGRYSIFRDRVAVDLRLVAPDETVSKFTVEGAKSRLADLVQTIVSGLEHRLPPQKPAH